MVALLLPGTKQGVSGQSQIELLLIPKVYNGLWHKRYLTVLAKR
jgi:hypothetical protein